MKTLLIFLALFLSNQPRAWSQSKTMADPLGREVTVKEVRPVLNDTKADSLMQRSAAFRDSLLSLKNTDLVLPVYSENMWRSLTDSLSNLPLGSALRHTGDAVPKMVVTKEELLGGIQQEFFSTPKDNLQSPLVTPHPASALNELPPSENQLIPLSNWSLPSHSLQDLTPLNSNALKIKQVPWLDSLRKFNIREARLKLVQSQKYQKGDLLTYAQKPSFLEKSYFEGLIGISGSNLALLQFSPALGYHFTDNLSLGIGPNILLRRQGGKATPSVGLRSFLKAEILDRKVYLQVEDILDSYGEVDSESREIFKRHSLIICAGYLLALTPSISLNLSVGYQLKNTRILNNEYAPWVFRTGISTLQRNNQ
jgi:hypothetical protein